MRTVLVLLALLAAGCIAPDASQTGAAPASYERDAPPPAERIQGMTADVSHTDKVVDCSSGVQVPPRYCAQRDLVATGRIGVEKLPVGFVSNNGGISIKRGTTSGDAWSFHAVVRVSAPTQDMANDGLDTAWSWSHEKNGQHRLDAGPTPGALAGQALGVGAQLDSAKYELLLPAWVEVDVLGATTTNGAIAIAGLHVGKTDASTTNGGIDIDGATADVTAKTTNGHVEIVTTPMASGVMDLTTTNGGIDVHLQRRAGHAYDVEGKTTNGLVTIQLDGGSFSANERTHKHFTSDGFDAAPVKVKLNAKTTNGAISVSRA